MINMPNKLIEASYYVPNKLINASYNMPLSAMRLRTLALSKLEPLSYLFGISNPVTESPRVCQRLNNLRNWNYEKIKSLYIRIS